MDQSKMKQDGPAEAGGAGLAAPAGSPVWYSLADWGSYDVYNGYQHNITHDKHASRDQAEGVCRLLEKDGFGGRRQVFPVRTWTSQTLPWENAKVSRP